MTGIPSQFHLLSNALSFAEQSHRVISQNISNFNTPHYKARELSFEKFLDAVKGAEPTVEESREFQLQFTKGLKERTDGNNVDLDREVANLKQNAMLFQTLSQLLASKMETMHRAISR